MSTQPRTLAHPGPSDPLGSALFAIPAPALALAVAVAYLALAQFVIWLNDPVNLGAGFWPAAGLSLGLLVLLPRSRWPWVIGAIAVAEFGGDLLHGYPLDATVMWTLANCIEPLVGALLIRRFSSGEERLSVLPKVLAFLSCGVLAGPLVGGTVGAVGAVFFGGPFADVWPKFVVGDALGVLVVAPVFLAWTIPASRRSWPERISVALAPPFVALLVFRDWGGSMDDVLGPYLLLPFLMWTALRFGVRGAAVAGFLVANIANWATAHDYGPFALQGEQAITLLQVFLGITIATGLMVAALVDDLFDGKEVERRLAQHNRELNAALEELGRSQLQIRKLEGILPICVTCKAVRSDDDSRWVPLDKYLTGVRAVSLSHTYCPTCTENVMAKM